METTFDTVWSKSKILVKGIIIFFLVLLLLIPTFYVQNLIEEREARQKEAIAEVSSKWAGRQTVAGPFIVLPYWQTEGDSTSRLTRVKHYAYFLPDDLQVRATVTPQEKHRGIYKVMLYNSRIHMAGTFREVASERLNIPVENILWDEASVKLSLSDTKGLNEELKIRWKDTTLALAPQTANDPMAPEALSAPLPVSSLEELKNVSFSSAIDLNGSEQLLFTPVGKSTTVQLQSAWPHPSFTGDILPQTTRVQDSGFKATWKSLSHKRSFPQQWKDNAYMIAGAPGRNAVAAGNNINHGAFGADLFVPVSGYQKTMRSVKYAILCILLTFAAFFLIETTHKRSVHPVQYGLIGLALVLFYTLLLSFSEYIGFNLSYLIASVATIGLITWFVKDILASGRL
ncbi:MAG TPA: cell envelope integrity protein CreD, partial [Chitinophagaceae bacterium]